MPAWVLAVHEQDLAMTVLRYLNNVLALMLTGVVRLVAGKDAALRTWVRYKL